METSGAGSTPTGGPATVGPDARSASVLREYGPRDNEIDLFKLSSVLWQGRWIILGMMAAFALGSAVVAALLPRVYTASVVLAPVQEDVLGGLAGQLGGLASLAGLGSRATTNVEAVAVLRSRDFIREFIEEQELLPVLFPKAWDAATRSWKVPQPPDAVQGAGFFVANVRRIDEDSRTSLVTLSIEWADPELAAAWANQLAARLNDHMRERALAEAEANVKYLRSEFETTAIVALQQSIGGLLESEMQKVMLARGNAEYAFRVIDRAEVPRTPSKPRPVLIVVLSAFFGGLLAVFVLFMRDVLRERSAGATPSSSPSTRPQ